MTLLGRPVPLRKRVPTFKSPYGGSMTSARGVRLLFVPRDQPWRFASGKRIVILKPCEGALSNAIVPPSR